MGTPFLGELKLVAFNFAPQGWAQCSGQFLPINQNQALFALLGTMYGGNGQTTFALPDLRGRAPIMQGAGFSVGQSGGQEFHTITAGELPTHTHNLVGVSQGADQSIPARLASANNLYGAPADLTTITADSVTTVGGSQAHENRSPFLTLVWCIALTGIFPSQN